MPTHVASHVNRGSRAAHRLPLAALVASLVSTAAVAQASRAPSPTDPAAAVPQARYDSAFTGYQPLGKDKLANWRDLNDNVGVMAGHNAQMRDIAKVIEAHATVVEVDRATKRLRVEQDPIRELGWPATAAFWQYTDAAASALPASGARVQLTLEKDATGDVYRVTRIAPSTRPAAAPPKPAPAAAPGGHKH
jgi:Cu/Ag efflux protein CusF